jgi:hypothetical protein
MTTYPLSDLILSKTASPHRSSPSDELTYQWHDFRGARHVEQQVVMTVWHRNDADRHNLANFLFPKDG